jgi:hypothetical protein
VAVEAQLANLHQRKSMPKAYQAVKTNHGEWQLPTFPTASQNVAVVAAFLDTLPTPSTDGVGKIYQQLKNILGTAAVQQAESSLQHRVEASI